MRALAHKAVNLDLPGKLDGRSTRGGPDVSKRGTPGLRRGNDRPLRAEALHEHGPSDVSLLATCKQSAQLASCSSWESISRAPTRISCAQDESEQYSQAAIARPLGHQSRATSDPTKLTAAPGVIRQRATVALGSLIGRARALLWSRHEHLGSRCPLTCIARKASITVAFAFACETALERASAVAKHNSTQPAGVLRSGPSRRRDLPLANADSSLSSIVADSNR